MWSSLDGRNYYFAVWVIRKVKILCLPGMGMEGLAFQLERWENHQGSGAVEGLGRREGGCSYTRCGRSGKPSRGDDPSLPLHLTPLL